MTPLLVHTRADLQDALVAASGPVGFVPTMGALHIGHASLMRTARQRSGAVVASIFVNPMQFGPTEDLAKYPRTLDDDVQMCADEGVDVVFAPSVEEVYPGGEPQVSIDPGPLATILEGAVRPTHFRGVLTVVAKLFGLVRPDLAVFGEKDYQQLTLIRRMVKDLCLGVEVIGAPTIREPDGLALSSRNRYLDESQRVVALALSRALRAGVEAGADGGEAVLAAAASSLARTPEAHADYLALTDPDLGPAPAEGEARLLVAARVGTTRLIDNMRVDLSAGHAATATR